MAETWGPDAVRHRTHRWIDAYRRHHLWIETAGCGILFALLLAKGIWPGWQSLNTDFPNYYLVARLFREGYSLDRIYDWIWLQRIKDHWGLSQPLVGFAGLTPFSAIPMVPLSIFSALVAKRLWIAANLLMLAASVEVLRRLTSLGGRRVWLLCLLAVFPLRTSFLLGQMHLLVLLLLVLACYFHQKDNSVACGVCITLAGALKIYPLLFAAYFLWKRAWRPLCAIAGATLLLILLARLAMGGEVVHVYATQILPRSIQGEILDPYNLRSASAAALFHRLFIAEPSLNPAPWLHSPALYSCLYPIWQMVILIPFLALMSNHSERPKREKLEWAAWVLLLLVLSPVPASYHFVVIIFPVVLLIDFLVRQRAYAATTLIVLLYSMISLTELFPHGQHGVSALFALARLWSELLLWAATLRTLWLYRAVSPRRSIVLLRNAGLALIAVAGCATAARSYQHHFAYLPQDYARRLPITGTSFLASSPRPANGAYVYIAMTASGYRVLNQAGTFIRNDDKSQNPQDQLSVATSQNATLLAIELAGNGGSEILVFPLKRLASGVSMVAPGLVAHAESPALSSDGATLAFIREIKGRGTIWSVRLDPQTGFPASEPGLIVDNGFDARDVSFTPAGLLLFTARAGNRSRIFSVVPGVQPRVFVPSEESVDSPAVSPDGRWLAYRRLHRDRWQLAYLNLTTGQSGTLTSGDCNAFTPSWMGRERVLYATDCGRGEGLTALASVALAPLQ